MTANSSDLGPISPENLNQLNSLLRGEIAAAETYQAALDKVTDSDDPEVQANVSLLREMQEDHDRAAEALKERIEEVGGEASDSSGAWGAWSQAVQGTMNLFGDSSALKGLKEGEEHGLKDLRGACDDVDEFSRRMIEQELIPLQERHLNLLDQLINSVGEA